MDITQKMESAETRITKAVFPNTTNHYATLFGGTALQWMDEAAFITATRFPGKKPSRSARTASISKPRSRPEPLSNW